MTPFDPLRWAAFHEAGHAVAILVGPHPETLRSVAVIPPGGGLTKGGFTPLVFAAGPIAARRAGAPPLEGARDDITQTVHTLLTGDIAAHPTAGISEMLAIVTAEITRIWARAEELVDQRWIEIDTGARALLNAPHHELTGDEFARIVGISQQHSWRR